MNHNRCIPLLAALTLVGCAQYQEVRTSSQELKEARVRHFSAKERAAHYLKAACESAPKAAQGNPAALKIYNTAAAELTALLRSTDEGRLWNKPLTLSASGETYKLRLQPSNRPGIWAPDVFSSFVPAKEVKLGSIKKRNSVEGIGGTLVGIRRKHPREAFAPNVGITAPVTATLDFKGGEAVLALRDPSVQQKAAVAGSLRPLAADFSAPLAYYPHVNELITGLMGALRVGKYMDTTGLYMLQPYDPNRIPVIFVHGLISTPRMWRNVINEIETDPILRGRYQYWVFGYPTGNPVAYTALRFRQDLAKAKQLYGFPHGFVLVGHSMGGIVSRMQGSTLTREDWDRTLKDASQKRFIARLGSRGLVHDAVLFNANPDLRRAIFICTPHRGSEMAISGLGRFAASLISLPGNLVDTMQRSVGDTLSVFSGKGKPPTSVTSLSPRNPTLKVLDNVPYTAPHHTILGNQGQKCDLEKSSDGVVPYWSSHLKTAKSEKVVPASHGACEHPETILEVQRILRLHLESSSAN